MILISATEPKVGARMRLAVDGAHDRRWWVVRARDERFVILTRQAPFEPKGTSEYSIVDLKRELRGPCNLLGGGWDIDVPGGVDSLLRALNYGVELAGRLAGGAGTVTIDEVQVEVSRRRSVPIEVIEIAET